MIVHSYNLPETTIGNFVEDDTLFTVSDPKYVIGSKYGDSADTDTFVCTQTTNHSYVKEVYREATYTSTGINTSFIDTTAKSGTTYYYTVRAYSGSTMSSYVTNKTIKKK